MSDRLSQNDEKTRAGTADPVTIEGKLEPDLKLNTRMMEALRHYSTSRFDMRNPHFFVHEDQDGWRTLVSVEDATAWAAGVLENHEDKLIALDRLQRGMRKLGLGWAYLRIMGEKL